MSVSKDLTVSLEAKLCIVTDAKFVLTVVKVRTQVHQPLELEMLENTRDYSL
jgi:hypothetical protein